VPLCWQERSGSAGDGNISSPTEERPLMGGRIVTSTGSNRPAAVIRRSLLDIRFAAVAVLRSPTPTGGSSTGCCPSVRSTAQRRTCSGCCRPRAALELAVSDTLLSFAAAGGQTEIDWFQTAADLSDVQRTTPRYTTGMERVYNAECGSNVCLSAARTITADPPATFAYLDSEPRS
jgi:hypothetical protein